MQQDKFLTTLGLCRRAGKLCYGYDMVVEALERTHAVFFAADLSDRSRNSISQSAARKGVPCYKTGYTMAEFSAAMGTKPVGILGVTESGFAALLVQAKQKLR